MSSWIGSLHPKTLSIGDSEDAYGRTLAYLYLDDREYEHLYNEELIRLGLARTTSSHAYRRKASGGCERMLRLVAPGFAELVPRPLRASSWAQP